VQVFRCAGFSDAGLTILSTGSCAGVRKAPTVRSFRRLLCGQLGVIFRIFQLYQIRPWCSIGVDDGLSPDSFRAGREIVSREFHAAGGISGGMVFVLEPHASA
jgi:hypothetical protein